MLCVDAESLLLCLDEIPWADDFIHKTERDFAQHGYDLQFFHLGTDTPKKQIIDQVIALARDFDVEEIFLPQTFGGGLKSTVWSGSYVSFLCP